MIDITNDIINLITEKKDSDYDVAQKNLFVGCIVKNKKNKKKYIVRDFGLNVTDNKDEDCVIYTEYTMDEDQHTKTFIREINEFYEKFIWDGSFE